MRPRALIAAFLLLATACTFPIPLPRLVFDTPTPAATAGPPPTPIPASLITFNVNIPANSPIGSAPAVALLDAVGGGQTTIVLTNSGSNLWTGGIQATAGAVLRYRYIRPLPSLVAETTPAGRSIPFRLFVVGSENAAIEDTVAAWDDTLFSGETGALEGRVWNANTTAGVMGMIVAAGGQTAITDRDGTFFLYGLPTGPQRVAVLAPDGSLRPVQAATTIQANQTATLDLVSADPNAVHLTFLVRPPAGNAAADAGASLRLVGDVWQLGDDFVLAANGSSITGARAPTLTPLADGRWTIRLLLYSGTVLRYKYTLGDGVWNGELDGSGSPRLRQLIVPNTDVLIDDSIAAWRPPGSASITLEALTPAETPGTDVIAVQFRPGGAWQPPLPMWRLGPNDWRFVLYNPVDFTGSVFYRYCRSFACGSADDASTVGPAAAGRFFTPALFGQNLRDDISAWQWLGPLPGGTGALPAINARNSFYSGFDINEDWHPAVSPVLAQTLDAMRRSAADWVTFNRLATPLTAAPTPDFADQLGLAPLPLAWRDTVDVAHAIGLRVALHPVTCHYTPYGACDYWTSANFTAAFWDAWFANYERHLLSQAELARQSAAEMLIVGDFKLRPALPGEPEAPPDAEARWRSLIARVRAIYAGSLGFELLMGDSVWPSPPTFLDAVDVIRLFWWAPLANSGTASVPDMAVTAGVLLDTHALPLQQRFNRPLVLSTAYLSVDGAATQCLRQPDGQCHSFEAFGPAAPDVTAHPLDLPEQADLYTALLLAINDRPWIGGLSSFGYHPYAALRDKSVSVRGKPAEAVLSAWWPLLQGR